jgi:hypothetical protein
MKGDRNAWSLSGMTLRQAGVHAPVNGYGRLFTKLNA